MPVKYSRIEELALITLNRPEALNALSVEVVKKIGEAIEEAADSDARALLITGEGEKAFCAGADISEFMDRNIVEAFEAAEIGQNTFAKLDNLGIPSLAVINRPGPCTGHGNDRPDGWSGRSLGHWPY